MDDDELLRIAESLEDSIDDEPQSRLSQGQPWPWLSLNRAGCIALAANLLRLASKPESPDERDVVQPLDGIDQINDGGKDLEIFMLRRSETVEREVIDKSVAPPRLRDRLALFGCAIVTVLFATVFVAGIYFWSQLIFGQG